ncbi:hypothetical protein HDU76_011783 [Blyttiomyces sp. JEL0837]|nr:hypothetical protein HDU76_011783 [Blyttiomyces sp. JEL0837]
MIDMNNNNKPTQQIATEGITSSLCVIADIRDCLNVSEHKEGVMLINPSIECALFGYLDLQESYLTRVQMALKNFQSIYLKMDTTTTSENEEEPRDGEDEVADIVTAETESTTSSTSSDTETVPTGDEISEDVPSTVLRSTLQLQLQLSRDTIMKKYTERAESLTSLRNLGAEDIDVGDEATTLSIPPKSNGAPFRKSENLSTSHFPVICSLLHTMGTSFTLKDSSPTKSSWQWMSYVSIMAKHEKRIYQASIETNRPSHSSVTSCMKKPCNARLKVETRRLNVHFVEGLRETALKMKERDGSMIIYDSITNNLPKNVRSIQSKSNGIHHGLITPKIVITEPDNNNKSTIEPSTKNKAPALNINTNTPSPNSQKLASPLPDSAIDLSNDHDNDKDDQMETHQDPTQPPQKTLLLTELPRLKNRDTRFELRVVPKRDELVYCRSCEYFYKPKRSKVGTTQPSNQALEQGQDQDQAQAKIDLKASRRVSIPKVPFPQKLGLVSGAKSDVLHMKDSAADVNGGVKKRFGGFWLSKMV